ncbi:MAG: hypothetical protein LBR22_11595 [Desulfovibrio sp.]|jgi:hypothetical protein|nr:hypothetical protein [Desulfovibrio sp.]
MMQEAFPEGMPDGIIDEDDPFVSYPGDWGPQVFFQKSSTQEERKMQKKRRMQEKKEMVEPLEDMENERPEVWARITPKYQDYYRKFREMSLKGTLSKEQWMGFLTMVLMTSDPVDIDEVPRHGAEAQSYQADIQDET